MVKPTNEDMVLREQVPHEIRKARALERIADELDELNQHLRAEAALRRAG